MGSGGDGRSSSCSSSGEEDGDADWRAAIDSVATTTTNGVSSTSNGPKSNSAVRLSQDNDTDTPKPQMVKHYQIKAQKLLDDILEKAIEVVKDPLHIADNDPMMKNDGGGIRLFKQAPPGIVFDNIVEIQGPKRRPRILPRKEIDEKSKKFRRELKSVAVDGMDILSEARKASEKSLAKLEASDEAAKAAAKKEEERIAELKRIRGERWLPSIAKYMQIRT